MSFWNYGLRKAWLNKCLRSHVSEHSSTWNMLKGQKHCCNLQDSIFIFFSHQPAGSCIAKCLSVTYEILGLLLKSILMIIVGIYNNQFKCNYLRNKKSELFAAFLKPKSTFKYFEKKDDLHILCISEITGCERRG